MKKNHQTTKTQVLVELNREYLKLKEGQEISIKFCPKLRAMEIPIRVFWESDDVASWTTVDSANVRSQFFTQMEDQINETAHDKIQFFQKKIDRLINKSNNYADQFNINHDVFWNQVLNFGRDQRNKEVEIKQLETQIEQVYERLCRLEDKLNSLQGR